MLIEKSFGEWLKVHRKALGFTQKQLAGQVHCSTITLRKIEAEERRPSTQIAERLADVFNIDEAERSAFINFARGSWKSTPDQNQTDEPWQAPTPSLRNNLPSAPTSLIGRTREIETVRQYLLNPEIRLVTLVGPPGIGKTRLAIETARELLSAFPDGVFFVSLGSLSDPLLVASSLIRALGFVDKKNRSAGQMLKDGIGDKQMLLILDNCEHLIEEIATLASGLLSTCSRLKILATSRESLRAPGEWLYSVSSLGLPDENTPLDAESVAQSPALLLFAERARAVRHDFSLNEENIPAVASICTQLDGLPLAIELIASRMRVMSPQAMLKHMNSQFVLSADGMRAVSTRQKTLRNAIRWSYDFLPPEDQKVFACLPVFAGGFRLDAAESIFSGMVSERTVTEIVTSLSDKSLLLHITDKDGELRFYMLFTIQQFARECFQALDSGEEVHRAHLAYFLDLAEQASREIHGPRQIHWLSQLDKESDNFRAALEFCLSQHETRPALQLISALSWFWGLWRHNSELRGWFDRLRELDGLKEHPVFYAQLLNRIGNSNWLAGDFQNARAILEESISIWKELGEAGVLGLAEAQCYLGMVAHSIDSNYAMAQSLFEDSLKLYQKQDSPWGIAFTSFNLGWIHDHTDNDKVAQKYLERSLQIFSELGDFWGMGRTSQFLGQLFLKQERFGLAERYFKQHLSIDEKLQFKPGIVIALGNLGDLYRFQENYDPAEQYFKRSLSLCREYGLKIDRGYNNYALGMLGLQKRDYEFAAYYIREYFVSGSPVSRNLATIDLCLGMAAVAGGMHQPERAATLYGAARQFLQSTDIPYTPFDRGIFRRHVQVAREQLGESGFTQFEQQGFSMTMEEAIAYALQE